MVGETGRDICNRCVSFSYRHFDPAYGKVGRCLLVYHYSSGKRSTALRSNNLLGAKNEYFFFEFTDLQDSHQDLLEKQTTWHSKSIQYDFTREATYFAAEAANNFAALCNSKQDPITREELHDAISDVLTSVTDLREEIFGFKGAKYNLSVYLYSPKKSRLVPFFRNMDDRLARNDREWQPGIGHVGFCFLHQETIISEDISKSPELARDNARGDEATYRSMCSTPIFSLSNDPSVSEVRGVFVVTSSAPNQFSQEVHLAFMETLATVLAIVIGLAYVRIPSGGNYV
jgi:GAF domain-containing protein